MAPGTEIVSRKVDGKTTVWAARDYIDALVDAGIASSAAFINAHASNIIDDVTRSKITSVTFSLEGRAFRIAAKEYLPRGGASIIKNVFRPSKARVELLLSAQLVELGVPVPAPVAAVEVRSVRILKKAYLFCEEIVGGASLLELMDSREHEKLERRRINKVIESIAKTVAGAHNAGLFHGDLNASHIIIKDWKEEDPKIYLVDFENSRIKKVVSKQERVRDLGRLERSASYFLGTGERLRFLKSYLRAAGAGESLRDWMQEISRDIARRAR